MSAPAPVCQSRGVPRRNKLCALVAFGTLASAPMLAGCPGAPAASSCPSDNADCPSPAPSYETDVGPLVMRYCARCHNPAGSDPRLLLQSYADVTDPGQRGHVITRISLCIMPPVGEPQPTADERNLILSWFACCAPSDAGGTCPP